MMPRWISDVPAAIVVPTMVTYDVLEKFGDQLGLTKFQQEKIRLVAAGAQESVRMAQEAGVRIGAASDLLGPARSQKGRDVVLMVEVIGPLAGVLAATMQKAGRSVTRAVTGQVGGG